MNSLSSSQLEPSLKQFYNHYHYKTCLKKICDIVVSIFRDFIFFLMIPYLRCSSVSLYRKYDNPKWSSTSAGLVVLVHGLKGHPSVWKKHINELEKTPNIDLYVPFVHLAGNCPLEEAATPIKDKIIDYINNHPLKPICLMGFSNGARIVISIETELRAISPQTPIMISTVAGVYFGSIQIDRLSKAPLFKDYFSHETKTELRYRSETSQKLMQKAQEETSANRTYEFYASTNDLAVPNIDSSLPYLNRGERFHVVHGYGHKSIVSGVADLQLKSCIKWLNAQ